MARLVADIPDELNTDYCVLFINGEVIGEYPNTSKEDGIISIEIDDLISSLPDGDIKFELRSCNSLVCSIKSVPLVVKKTTPSAPRSLRLGI